MSSCTNPRSRKARVAGSTSRRTETRYGYSANHDTRQREREPEFSHELRGLDNVVLTPHIGSGTRETREAMGMLAVEALNTLLNEQRTPHNVVA